VSFGYGTHFCVGHSVARTLGQVVVEEMFARLPGLRLDPEHPPFVHGWAVRGAKRLPVVWEALTLSEVDASAPIGSIVAVTVDGRRDGRDPYRDRLGAWCPTRCPQAQLPVHRRCASWPTTARLICNCHGSEFDPQTGALLLVRPRRA